MIEISNLFQGYDGAMMFKDFSINIPSHKVTSIIGPSGCGKSTLLKTLAGILPFKKGTIKGVNKSCISMVFQEDRLLPWLTAVENIKLVLNDGGKGRKKNYSDTMIEEILDMLDMKSYRFKKTDELSGGMLRRISIARALVYDKANKGNFLILDEPFKGLDYKLKSEIIDNLKNEWKKYGKTIIMVTHDNNEAKVVSDCIIELSGRPVKAEFHVD